MTGPQRVPEWLLLNHSSDRSERLPLDSTFVHCGMWGVCQEVLKRPVLGDAFGLSRIDWSVLPVDCGRD